MTTQIIVGNQPAEAMLGTCPRNRKTRIMATLPTEAAKNPPLVFQFLEAGMDIARIDCAQGNQDTWLKMVQNLKKACSDLKKSCKIMLHLEGPNLSIGEFLSLASAIRIEPTRNEKGQVIKNATVRFVQSLCKGNTGVQEIPVDKINFNLIKSRDIIYLRDAAGRSRKMEITEVGKKHIEAESDKSIYLETGIRLMFLRRSEIIDHATVGQLPTGKVQIRLFAGDELVITPSGTLGQPEIRDRQGLMIDPARISCNSRHIFEQAQIGHRIILGNGKLEGTISRVTDQSIRLTISYAPKNGVELHPGQHIHLPDTYMPVSPLTETDYRNIATAAQYADFLGLPAIKNAEELQMINTFLDEIASGEIGLFLPVETAQAYHNLNEILKVGIKQRPIGLLFSPFKISQELGFDQFPNIRKQVMQQCQQLQVPVILTDKLLQKMCKQGQTSASEINSALSNLDVDAVCIGEGDFTTIAIKQLDTLSASSEQA